MPQVEGGKRIGHRYVVSKSYREKFEKGLATSSRGSSMGQYDTGWGIRWYTAHDLGERRTVRTGGRQQSAHLGVGWRRSLRPLRPFRRSQVASAGIQRRMAAAGGFEREEEGARRERGAALRPRNGDAHRGRGKMLVHLAFTKFKIVGDAPTANCRGGDTKRARMLHIISPPLLKTASIFWRIVGIRIEIRELLRHGLTACCMADPQTRLPGKKTEGCQWGGKGRAFPSSFK